MGKIKDILGSEIFEFPKYATQIINLANQNAQGTRPKVVGQMSDLIQEFSGKSIKEWEKWYLEKHPDAIDNATHKITEMVENLREVIQKIDEEMISRWVKDLVIIKTFIGLRFQEAVLKKVADIKSMSYRLANPDEESKGIDGYIGETPVSIKSSTYKSKQSLLEEIKVKIIYYDKTKDGIEIDIENFI